MGDLVKSLSRGVVRRMSTGTRRRLARALPRSTLAHLRRAGTDAYLVSFPKCGRTWLKVLVGRAMQQHFGLPDDANLMELHRLADLDQRVPCIRATHDDDAQWKSPAEIGGDKQWYRGSAVMLLVRDPRDVIVSLYHQKRHRRAAYTGTLDDFLDDPVGGFDSLLRFYDAWADDLSVPARTLVVRYEDLHLTTQATLRTVLEFVGVLGMSDQVVREAVAFASFDNMRQLEEADAFGSDKLRPAAQGNYDSYKTRRGRVGGFRDELTSEQIANLDRRMAASRADAFGYLP